MRVYNDTQDVDGRAAFEHGMGIVLVITKQNGGWLKCQP